MAWAGQKQFGVHRWKHVGATSAVDFLASFANQKQAQLNMRTYLT